MTRLESASSRLRLALCAGTALAAGAAFLCVSAGIMQLGLREWGNTFNPLMLPQYLWLYPDDPEVEKWAWRGAAAAGLLVFFGLGGLLKKRIAVHGKARWASEAEIRRTVNRGDGLREDKGIMCGQKDGRFLCFGGNEHVICYAPTRSGKGYAIAIPNLLNFPDSAVVLDVKQENFEKTAGFRKAHGQEVYLFDPLTPDGRTARYNPLGHIDRNDPVARLDELQRIAAMLFPDPPKADPVWAQSARTGFVGTACYIAETPALPFTIGEVYRQLSTGDTKEHIRKIVADRAAAKAPLSQHTQLALDDFISAPDNMFGSTKKTITSGLGLWLNPHVDHATSTSDFDLRDLRRRRMTIYLGVSPDNMERVQPLYGLFFQQLIDLNTRVLPANDPESQHQVLLVLDEFKLLGQAHIVASAFSYVAGYDIRMLPIIQSPSQLRSVYGPDVADEIMTNCGVEIIFTPKELPIAQNLSERIGYLGVESKSVSRPWGLDSGRRTQTQSEQRRALMLPQELLQMSRKDLIVMRAGIPPVRGKKIVYFEQEEFIERLLPPPEIKPIEAPPIGPDPREQERARLEKESAKLREKVDEMASEIDRLRASAPADGPRSADEALPPIPGFMALAGAIAAAEDVSDEDESAAEGNASDSREMTDDELTGAAELSAEAVMFNFDYAGVQIPDRDASEEEQAGFLGQYIEGIAKKPPEKDAGDDAQIRRAS